MVLRRFLVFRKNEIILTLIGSNSMITDPLTKSISEPKIKYFYRFHHGNVENANVGGMLNSTVMCLITLYIITTILCVKLVLFNRIMWCNAKC